MTMELQQSPLYQQYITSLRWGVSTVQGITVFSKRIPFLGVLAKIQRPEKLPDIPDLVAHLHSLHVRQVSIEPKATEDEAAFNAWIHTLAQSFRIMRSPFLPTKTIRINLKRQELDLFNACTSAKRRAVRKAQKNGLTVKETNAIHELIAVKNSSAGLFGGITTYGIDKLWNIFSPKKKAYILLAKEKTGNVVGGVLLLTWNTCCYYWIAGATQKGKKLFAPTLLVWESIKLARRHRCRTFDFVGVWDERRPRQYTAWKGFTKFKEGFGGQNLYYPLIDPNP